MTRFTASVLLIALVPSLAEADTLSLRGIALPACSLLTPVDGTLALNGDQKSWSTVTPASIVAINTAPATLTVTRPNDWASAPSGTPSTTFSVSARTMGVNVGTLLGSGSASSGPLSALGVNDVIVSLSAVSAQPYRAGLHVAEVTVTCTVP